MKPRNELANDYHNRLPEGPFQKSFVHGAFVNGYDAGYQAAQQWIPISERLPEELEEILWCHAPTSEMAVGQLVIAPPYFTHWMPLPEAPKEDK